MYSTFNEGKAVVIERFNRRLKIVMWKYFAANNTRFHFDALDQMVKNYNDKVHSTIKMTPKEASKDINRGKVYFNIIRKQNKSRTSIKYRKCDNFRISKYKRHFEKEYTPNWSEEIFAIDKINMTNLVTYQVRSLSNENNFGSFYTRELSPANPNIFRIEKGIKRKRVGYSDKHNSWVPFSYLINI